MPKEILHIIEECETAGDRQFVTALARGLGVLYALRFYPQGIAHQQICEMTDLPKATVSRLLHTLIQLRFLRQNPLNNLYQPDIRYIELSHSAQIAGNPAEAARPLMSAFAQRHHVSVSLAVEEYGEMLYLQSIRSPARVVVQLTVGSTVPLADTAIGRAYFAALGTQSQRAVEDHLRKILPDTYEEKMAKLSEQTNFFLQHGYAASVGEFSPDVTAVAVVLNNPTAKHGIYALNASVPSSLYTLEELSTEVVEPLKQLAWEIERNSIRH